MIVADLPICDDYIRTVRGNGTVIASSPVVSGLRPLPPLKGVRYNATTQRIDTDVSSFHTPELNPIPLQQDKCTLKVDGDMWNTATLSASITCHCLNDNDECVNATYFGDMKYCPRPAERISPADKILYTEFKEMNAATSFHYTDMRVTEVLSANQPVEWCQFAELPTGLLCALRQPKCADGDDDPFRRVQRRE